MTGGYANHQAIIISANRGQHKTFQTPFFCLGGKHTALGQRNLLEARQSELPSDSIVLHPPPVSPRARLKPALWDQ